MDAHSLGRRARVVTMATLIAVALLAGAAVPAAAQSAGDGDVCPTGSGNSLVVLLPDGTAVQPGDEVALYTGTEAELFLCSDGDYTSNPTGSLWELNGDAVDGVVVDDDGALEYRYEITFDGVDEPTPVDFGSGIDGPSDIDEPSVTATPGHVAVLSVGEEQYRVSLSNADEAETLRQRSQTYASTASEMRDAASSLRSANESGVDASTVETVNQTGELNESYAAVQTTLFAAAADGDEDAAAALDAYHAHRDDTVASAREGLNSAQNSVQRDARSAAMSVLLNVLGLLAVGAVIGGAGGWYYTKGIMEDVDYKRSRVSGFDFGSSLLAKQLVVAGVLLVAAVGIVVGTGLTDTLVAVFRAVIPL